jgi:predicted phage terminase large subunit-like protein
MAAWAERLELHDLVQKTVQTCKKFKVDTLLIENKASGYSVAQELRRLFAWEDWSVKLVDPKGQDKLARLYSVQHLFSESMVFAPDRAWADQVITQTSVFPRGKHDDLVDTVSQALRHVREIGVLERNEERMAEMSEALQYHSGAFAPLYPS